MNRLDSQIVDHFRDRSTVDEASLNDFAVGQQPRKASRGNTLPSLLTGVIDVSFWFTPRFQSLRLAQRDLRSRFTKVINSDAAKFVAYFVPLIKDVGGRFLPLLQGVDLGKVRRCNGFF